jgi:hypothetical protein
MGSRLEKGRIEGSPPNEKNGHPLISRQLTVTVQKVRNLMLTFLETLVAFIGGQFISRGTSMKSTQFTWGETVRIRRTAPQHFRPGELAEICGMWTVETEANASARGSSIGSTTYTIEFGDGTSVEIAEQYLEKYFDE